MDNGFPQGSFDRVWVLESSHLMRDRDRLIAECARVLRPGGRLVLCDLVRRREIPFLELRARTEEFRVLRAAFGSARMDPLEDYASYAASAGLTEVETEDVTTQTRPTFDRWQDNVTAHRDEVTGILGAESVDQFDRSCEILRAFWDDGTLGYGLVTAVKPGDGIPG
jgi:27-O-demethylrifamycin SV methyltransferase